jgi:hypothetical protein
MKAFWALEELGGDDTLEGYYPRRFLGSARVLVNAEVRRHLGGCRVRLREDRPDDRRHRLPRAARNRGEHVAHEVDATALPGRPAQHGRNRPLEALVCIGDDEPHAPQPALHQAAQKRRPEGPILRRAGIDVVSCGIDSERMRDGRSFFTRPRLGDFHHVRGHYRPRNFADQKIRIE